MALTGKGISGYLHKYIRMSECIWPATHSAMRMRVHVKLGAVSKKKAQTVEMEMLFRALADRTRLRLLNLMGRDEVCVCYFVEVLRTPQPKISRHLAYLKKAGVVAARREGKWMHYRIIEPTERHAAQIFT